jgi:low temperature requirement protein LtrA
VTALSRLLEPPRLRTLEIDASEERHATWLELFLDLVFVVAITQVGTTLSSEPTAAGFVRYLALFVPIWWAWAGFTFYATRFDTDDLVYRTVTLLGMFAVAALATTIPDALHGGQNAFVLAYVAVRLFLLVLYARARRHVPEARQLTTWFMIMFGAAVLVWLVSLAVPTPWKYVLWMAAVGLELAAPPRAWRMMARAPIDPSHIPERFGLLTIIVLGEAVIAVVLGTESVSWTFVSGTAAFGGFLVAAAIWWIYFEFLDASMVRRSVRSGMTFVYAHYLVAAGIAAVGVGVKLAILSAEAGGRYDDTGWVTAVGAALCMAGLAAIQLATPPVLLDLDVWLRLGAAVGAAVLAALSGVLSPILVVWLLAAALVAEIVFELLQHETHSREPATRPQP